MRLLIIRHGDPDYAIDGLTEKGKIEAKLLCDKLCREKIDYVYCSPLGRAKRTIEPTLEKLSLEAKYVDWLREFNYVRLNMEDMGKEKHVAWDILPEFINANPDVYLPNKWKDADFVGNTGVAEAYDEVCREFDKCLAAHGYERCGSNYKAVRPNHDTVVLVCHFGLASVLLSHLFNSSPYSLWQHTCLAPSSVTTIYTEERREGEALFRAQSIGDTSHLYVSDEPPAFAARFCECFTDDTRHD